MINKILLVNDDGIYADSFKKTIEAFKNLGYQITICAPLHQQSAKSHAIEIREKILIKRIYDYQGIEAYAIDAPPADCVRFAKYYLKWDGDLVVSGINNGANLGDDILYSGTIGAAAEAGIRGYNALALSAGFGKAERCTSKLKEIMDFIEENKLFSKWPIWSINVPKDAKEFKFAHQGNVNFDTYFFEEEKDNYKQLGSPHHELDNDPNSDVYLYSRNFITYSPIDWDRTCCEKVKE